MIFWVVVIFYCFNICFGFLATPKFILLFFPYLVFPLCLLSFVVYVPFLVFVPWFIPCYLLCCWVFLFGPTICLPLVWIWIPVFILVLLPSLLVCQLVLNCLIDFIPFEVLICCFCLIFILFICLFLCFCLVVLQVCCLPMLVWMLFYMIPILLLPIFIMFYL